MNQSDENADKHNIKLSESKKKHDQSFSSDSSNISKNSNTEKLNKPARQKKLRIKNNKRSLSKSSISKSQNNIHSGRNSMLHRNDTNKTNEAIIVDPENGHYKTIQAAIDSAKKNSVIQICSGLYRENIYIYKAPLRIEAKDASAEVYIMGHKGPTLHINVPSSEGKIFMNHIRLIHKGGGGNKFFNKMKEITWYKKV